MNSSLKIKINLPVIAIITLSSMVMYCKYTVEARQGYLVFPVEIFFSMLLLVRLRGKKRMISRYGKMILIFNFSFMLYRIVSSSIITGEFYYSAKKIIYYEVGVFFLIILSLQLLSIESLISIIRFIGIANALIGVYETFSKTSVFLRFIYVSSRRMNTSGLGTTAARARTFFIHPTICAVFCVFTWCVFLYYPLKNKWLNIFSMLLILICMLGTQSRSSWIAFALISVVFIIQKFINRDVKVSVPQLVLLGSFLLATVIVFFLFNDFFEERLAVVWNRWQSGMDINNAANYNRVAMIKLGIRDFAKDRRIYQLFGRGLGYGYRLLQRHSIRGWRGAVDNTFLTTLLDYGIIGCTFLIGYLLIIIKCIFEKRKIYQLCGLVLLSLYVSCFFYDMYGWFTPNLLISMSLCIIAYADDNEIKRNI